MQTRNRLFDDLARVLSGAAGATAGLRGDLEVRLRERIDRMAERMQLVGREEFDTLREMAETARQEQEELALKVKALEEALAALRAEAAPKRASRKPAAKSASAPQS
ncbi:MAG: accessory factor UbiK family protein [Rhodospirillales bacterium]|nr:accessory factor UbiK family protein [Rhodospirillales bacterium]